MPYVAKYKIFGKIKFTAQIMMVSLIIPALIMMAGIICNYRIIPASCRIIPVSYVRSYMMLYITTWDGKFILVTCTNNKFAMC